MKAIRILGLSLTIILHSCSIGTAEKKDNIKTLYTAIHKNDTATFKINMTDKVFHGQLEINYRGAYKDSGGVTGIIKGDTLRGTYRYQHYGIEKWHSIPIALLKRGDKLIMGEGMMEVYMGMYYFKKNAPVNYQQPRFIFEKSALR